MTVEYETAIYNTAPTNLSSSQNPGFAGNHYDTTPSPLSSGGQGTNSILGPGGIMAGASSVFGGLSNIGTASPMDLLNTAIQGANLYRNASNISKAGVKEEGYSILNGVLGNISAQHANVLNPDGSVTQVPAMDRVTQGVTAGIQQVTAPAGINLYTGNNTSMNGVTQATQRRV
jgi:hypothetical protein